MFEQRRQASLVDQHVDEFFILDEVSEHSLDRHQVHAAGAVGGLGAVDLCHAAEGNPVKQVIAAVVALAA